MRRAKKPSSLRFEDVYLGLQRGQVEQRKYERYGMVSRPGRSSVMIVCPFCRLHFEAFMWSLNGGGKRCDCGALHDSKGNAFAWVSTVQAASADPVEEA